MLIENINITNKRSIKNATCDKVPKLMIIAGPNGAGKSTFLHELKKLYQGRAIYIGPHRQTRRQNVSYRSLIANEISLENVLKSPEVQGGIEGMTISDASRDAWGSDEALNYLKHGLCQIEIQRKEAISDIFDRDGKIDQDSMPDLWQPLRDLTHHLLPHLKFNRIDISNRNGIKCLWDVHIKGAIVDIDELSSGEKAIIQIFYPLIEHRIKSMLKKISSSEEATKNDFEVTVLIDEPELHLHPNLQQKILDYFRVLSSDENIQIICTTQSPTLVEHASYNELFVLKPSELLEEGENQLNQLAGDEDKLMYLKTIFGSTSNITALQPVIIVEGIPQNRKSNSISDRKLYRALHEKFDEVTLISGGGKNECLKLLEILDVALKEFSSKLKVVALLDSDTNFETTDDRVFTLPVSMIENFLLDPESIWETIQSVIEKTEIKTVKELEETLDQILSESEPKEITRRVLQELNFDGFRPKAPLAEIGDQLKEHILHLEEKYKAENINVLNSKFSTDVDKIKADSTRRELFMGKNVLDEFYKKYLHSTGLAKPIFKFEAARHARLRSSVKDFFESFFNKIEVK